MRENLICDVGSSSVSAYRGYVPSTAKVLIDGPSELIFDYALPEGVSALPGCRVRVPLRNKAATGTILHIASDTNINFELKPITSLIDPEP
ncbi:MAG: hypothetical protein VX633_01665, partial [Verrucomicrobiota bacterium]|nr:hypothetical protein [Verrucomicrobiota bacterium]